MKLEFVGYHGTRELTRNILEKGRLKVKHFNPISLPGDLGTGTYFFLNDPDLAYGFAEKFSKKTRTDSGIKVIECTIEIDNDDILNLNDPEIHSSFLEFKDFYLETAKKTLSKLQGDRNCVDGIIINRFINLIKEQDKKNIKAVIKDTYTPTKGHSFHKGGRDHYFVSNFFNGTEMCLRDVKLVSEGVVLDGL